MKISEVVSHFISEIGTRVVFGVSGGASLHLLNAVQSSARIRLVCLHHEQSVAMAAESYSRLTHEVGVGIVTSGPGATNLVTGIAGAFYDSIPCIYITGQVSVNRSKGDTGVRQRGFQETPIVEMVREITKYAVSVVTPDQVIPALIKGYELATTGRMGPVLIDIPDDIQRMEVVAPIRFLEKSNLDPLADDLKDDFVEFSRLLSDAERPVIILGSGLKYSKNSEYIKELLTQSSIPISTTWGAKELVSASNPALLGTFGTHGSRFANVVIQKADLIISIGSRLDLKATGTPVDSFAPNAKKVMFDIDTHESGKFRGSGMNIDLPLSVDLSSSLFQKFFNRITEEFDNYPKWMIEINSCREGLSPEKRVFAAEGINPYDFISILSDAAPSELNLLIDTGCAIAWTMQSWNVKLGQTIIHDFNNTAMGWSIPATIASIYTLEPKQTYCIVGDGSIMMSLGELASLKNTKRNVVIFLLNNAGYAMIKQTQDQWFGSNYFASDSDRDLIFPDFRKLSSAFEFDYTLIESLADLENLLPLLRENVGVKFCEIKIQHDARVIPIVKFGNPNHLMEPEN